MNSITNMSRVVAGRRLLEELGFRLKTLPKESQDAPTRFVKEAPHGGEYIIRLLVAEWRVNWSEVLELAQRLSETGKAALTPMAIFIHI